MADLISMNLLPEVTQLPPNPGTLDMVIYDPINSLSAVPQDSGIYHMTAHLSSVTLIN